MTTQTLTLSIPGDLYEHIRDRARQRHRSMEDETLDLLAASIPAESLPPDLSSTLKELKLLDDEALWRAAASRLSTEAASELESLHLKRQREGLSPQELQAAATLAGQYERAMLIRAKAAELLHARGHDISGLLKTR